MLLGAHVSTAGGVDKSPLNGQAIGCTAIQIFTKNQRQWSANPLSGPEVVAYSANVKESGIASVVAHDSYLINMASPDPAMRKKSITAFIDEIQRADLLHLQGLVFHPGSHMGEGEDKGVARMAQSLNQAAAEAGGSVPLLFETTAGQGTNLGWRFEHLRDMLAGLKTPGRYGVCLDTCHLYGAGHDLTTEAAYAATLAEFDRIVGLSRVRCIHINDSKQPLGSRKDRHDNIGAGFMGETAFRLIMNDPRFENVPKILETPGGDEAYVKDMKTLNKLVKKAK
ncbi:MAG: deoxyribonuclease IV [Fibrobacterota bacterium]